MGGHGAIKLSMLHPGVFSAVYGLNPALLGWGKDVSPENPAFENQMNIESLADLPSDNPYAVAIIGVSQAFSPNPKNPPFLMDYPFEERGGELVENGPGWKGWEANMPLYMLETHGDKLRGLRALRFDSAFIDEYAHIPPTSKAFSEALTSLGIPHTFEMYNGDHRNRLWGRTGRLYTEFLPFFSHHLAPSHETAQN